MFFSFSFLSNSTASSKIYTLSLHDALPILLEKQRQKGTDTSQIASIPFFENLFPAGLARSEEHTSELQSRSDLVCRLLLEKKKNSFRSIAIQTFPTHLHLVSIDALVSPTLH